MAGQRGSGAELCADCPVGSTALQRARSVKRRLQLGMRGKQRLTFLQTPLCPDGKGYAKAVSAATPPQRAAVASLAKAPPLFLQVQTFWWSH